MLRSVTRNWVDNSTTTSYRFTFLCDRCGSGFESSEYEFLHHFPSPVPKEQAEAFDILWRTDHALAFERANLEASAYFNECISCGEFVCPACYEFSEHELCGKCMAKKETL